MGVLQPLFQGNDTTDQTALIFRLLFRDLVEQRAGILSEIAFQVVQRQTGADASVDVKSGSLMISGAEVSNQGFYHVVNDKDINLQRPAPPDTALSRKDTVIVYIRDSVYPSGQIAGEFFDEAVCEWVTGTPTSGVPQPPDLDTLGYKNYYKLAHITVPAGSPTTPTTSSNITDIRTAIDGQTHNRAVGVGGITVCTSTTRPSAPRHGQMIWEEDTKRLLVNEGGAAPTWTIYGTSGLARWQNYSSSFPLTGSGITTWGRYIKLGRVVFGTAGFRFSATGTGNLVGNVQCRIPVRAANPQVPTLLYVGGGRGFNSTGFLQGVYWSATASIAQDDLYLRNFATRGLPLWNTTNPFDWGSGTSDQKADQMEMFFCFESAE